jgi:hypothetical protein
MNQKAITQFALSLSIVTLTALFYGFASADPAVHPRQNLFPDLEIGLEPQFVLGDLNEDGIVDRQDRALLAATAGRPATAPPRGVSCVAAGDLNFDRRVDGRDLKIMDEWLAAAPRLEAPALNFQPSLPCSFRRPFVALSPQLLAGGSASIRFLQKGVSSSNARVTVYSGSASVTREASGYAVNAPASAKSGELIDILITMPDRREYLYTYQIAAHPVPPARRPR